MIVLAEPLTGLGVGQPSASTLSVGALALALGLDVLLGEPPTRLHPVAWFGRLVAPFDREWTHPRTVGVVVSVLLPVVAAVTVATIVAVLGRATPLFGAVLAGIALFVSTSLRRLLVVAREVARLSETDLADARTRLRALAGRDASALSSGEVRSAVVESVTENLADGLVAPLGAFAVFAVVGQSIAPSDAAWVVLSLASAGAVWVKAVNTLDSMLGYHHKPVGWASARLDDAVMWVPARASALTLAVVCGRPGALVATRRWLRSVPSPNSGWPMGVAAASLDVRLHKPDVYDINTGRELPTMAATRRAIWRVAVVGLGWYLLAGVAVWH